MILTAVPGATSVKLVVDADHPLVRELARTNLAPNPNFQNNSVTPAVPSGAATLSVSSPPGKSPALKITPNNTGFASAAYPLGVGAGTMARLGLSPGDTLTISATCILGDNPVPYDPINNYGDPAYLRISVGFMRNGVQTFNVYSSDPHPNEVNVARRLSVTFTIPQDATELYVRLMNGDKNPATVCWWDGILVERGQILGSYFDGAQVDTDRAEYAWTGTPNNSPSTLVTVRSPLDGPAAVNVPMKVGYANLQGPYRTSDSDRMQRLPYHVQLVLSAAMDCDLFAAVELHEENDMHRYFLAMLQAKDPDWDLAEGDGGNHLLYRPSIYTATGRSTMMPGNRSMSDFTITDKVTGFQTHGLVTHLRADDNGGKSRRAEREAEVKFLAQYASKIKNVFLAGDFNFESSQITYLKSILAGAGLYGLQARQPQIAYGDQDSYSGALTGRWIEDIFTRNAQTLTNAAGVLLDPNASDHYLGMRSTITFVATSNAPTPRMTVWRNGGEVRVALPGWKGVEAATTVITDHAAPLGRDFTYTVELSDGSTTTTAPVRIDAALPLLTHPVTGATAPAIIQSWPDRNTETGSTLVKVPGRRSPVVLTDLEALGTSAPVLLTTTREQERALENLVATGDVLLLRTLYPELPDAFLAVTARQSSRPAEFKGTSPERLNALTAQEIGAEDMREPGRGDTLASIAAALPGGTLQDLADLFPGGTLLDIAVNDWLNAGIMLPTDPGTPTDPTPTPSAVYPGPDLYPSSTLYPGA